MGWFIPFPLAAGGIASDTERVQAEPPWLWGVPRDGTTELELILGGGQSLTGSPRPRDVSSCPGALRASTEVPRSRRGKRSGDYTVPQTSGLPFCITQDTAEPMPQFPHGRLAGAPP